MLRATDDDECDLLRFKQVISDAKVSTKVKLWSQQGKSLKDVQKLLGLSWLTAASPKFKYYDAFVTSQVPLWAKKGFSTEQVKVLLGIDKLSDQAMIASVNYKYYGQYLTTQIPAWMKQDLSLQQVRVILGIDHVADRALSSNVLFKYYSEFVNKQIPHWVKKDTPPDDIFMALGLNKLETTTDFASSSNFNFYQNFMHDNVEKWAMSFLTADDVAKKLNLAKLEGNSKVINNVWLNRFTDSADEFRVSGRNKQHLSSFDVWQKLGLNAMSSAQRESSAQFQTYKLYVKELDDAIDLVRPVGLAARNAISLGATAEEMEDY